MKSRRMTGIVMAAAALVAPAVTFAPSAHAATVCLENNTLTFNPPLNLSNQIGTATLNYSNTCADAPGLTPASNSGTIVFSYFGSCLAAIVTGGTETVVVGGVVYVVAGAGTGVFVKGQVLHPDGTCPGSISSAHGTGVAVTAP